MTMFRTSASAGADGPIVVLSGEADTTTAALLREMLTTQLDTGARLVIVDASGLSFLNSASLRVLVLAARALRGRHGTLVLARPQPLVARMLEITGADRLLDVRESLAPVHSLDGRQYQQKHRYLVEMITGVPVVAAPAEIDISSADQLRLVLLEMAAHGYTTVVADMTRTQFCDCSGLGVPARAHKRALEEGGELRLVIPRAGECGPVAESPMATGTHAGR